IHKLVSMWDWFRWATLVICILQSVSSLRIFHRGRQHGGNVQLWSNSDLSESMFPPEQWFTQQLDHFDPTNQQTWQQRYFTNSTFHKSGGPVFLMIGGEGEASAKWMLEGQWIEDAQLFNALCFQLEHRYYGKSRPTQDTRTENLVYLSSEQALADLAYFIEAMNQEHQLPTNTKWIVHGGSYPGSLAAWMRMRYPHLVHGAMSASGPLLAKLDFKEYFTVVKDALSEYNPECVKSVKEAFQQVGVLLKHMIGQRSLNKLFRLCDNINVSNGDDVASLYENLASNFAGVVQYNKDNRPRSPTNNITIDVVCDVMVDRQKGTPVHRLALVNEMLLKASNQTCLDYTYEKMIRQLSNTSWDSVMAEGGRQWTYQTCVEFGFFQTSSMTQDLFSDKFPVDFFTRQCSDIFGSKFTKELLEKGIQRTNTLYGDLHIQANHIVFAHGSTDPWHALGITKTIHKGAPAIYIKDTAHCAVMYPSRESDLPQLKEARKTIRSLVANWLKEEI
ncbi:Putative serine protease, partial [Frankliniella fusca]